MRTLSESERCETNIKTESATEKEMREQIMERLKIMESKCKQLPKPEGPNLFQNNTTASLQRLMKLKCILS